MPVGGGTNKDCDQCPSPANCEEESLDEACHPGRATGSVVKNIGGFWEQQLYNLFAASDSSIPNLHSSGNEDCPEEFKTGSHFIVVPDRTFPDDPKAPVIKQLDSTGVFNCPHFQFDLDQLYASLSSTHTKEWEKASTYLLDEETKQKHKKKKTDFLKSAQKNQYMSSKFLGKAYAQMLWTSVISAGAKSKNRVLIWRMRRFHLLESGHCTALLKLYKLLAHGKTWKFWHQCQINTCEFDDKGDACTRMCYNVNEDEVKDSDVRKAMKVLNEKGLLTACAEKEKVTDFEKWVNEYKDMEKGSKAELAQARKDLIADAFLDDDDISNHKEYPAKAVL